MFNLKSKLESRLVELKACKEAITLEDQCEGKEAMLLFVCSVFLFRFYREEKRVVTRTTLLLFVGMFDRFCCAAPRALFVDRNEHYSATGKTHSHTQANVLLF